MNNEDKILSLLEQMNKRLDNLEDGQSGLVQRLDKMDDRFDKMDDRLDKVENELQFVKNTTTRIELEQGKMLGLLYDGYLANTETLNEHTEALNRLENKVDKLSTVQNVHDIEIKKFAK